MKKFIIITALVSIAYTAYFYAHILQTQNTLYTNLQKQFLDQKEFISERLAFFANESTRLANINDPSLLQKEISTTVLSIVIHSPSETPQTARWLKINLDTLQHSCTGIFIAPKNDSSYLAITYNLNDILASIELLSFGFESFAHATTESNDTLLPFHAPKLVKFKNSAIHFEEPLTNGWTLTFSGTWKELYPFSTEELHSVFILLILWGITLTAAVALLNLWASSFVFNAFCVAILVFLFLDFPSRLSEVHAHTLSFAKTKELLQEHPNTILIPTTVYLESLSFPNDTSFLITGFISQIYPKNASIKQGFIFPEESILYKVTITEMARVEKADSVIITWHFGTTLTGSFPPTFFPFDRRQADIVLWPLELHQNVIFLPNFSNYESLIPETTPGISPYIKFLEWKVKKSSFLIENNEPYKFLHLPLIPITYKFSVLLIRDFLNAFLSNTLSLALCIMVSFLILFIPRARVLEALFPTISIFVGIIFVAVTNHTSLRTTLHVSSFAYIEYFFVSFYILILTILTFFIFGRKAPFLTLCYWPILIGSFTLILSLSFLLG